MSENVLILTQRHTWNWMINKKRITWKNSIKTNFFLYFPKWNEIFVGVLQRGFCYSFYQPTILFYFVYVPIGAQEYTALQKRNGIRIDTNIILFNFFFHFCCCLIHTSEHTQRNRTNFLFFWYQTKDSST